MGDQNHTLVFDFTANGEQLDWIEDIKDMEFDIDVGKEVIKAKPTVTGEGKNKGLFFMGSGKDTFYVIQ